MKKQSLGWFCLIFVFFLVGCSNTAPVEEVTTEFQPTAVLDYHPNLAFTLPYDPTSSLHPCYADTQINITLMPLIYEGLFRLNSSFQAEPVLVEDWSMSYDATKWVFEIKSGILFWDGTELTSLIVASSLNEARNSKSRFAPRLSDISSVTAWGNQVTIQLKSPNFNLPALLDVPISYGGGDVPQGTGAYEYFQGVDTLYLRDVWWQLGDHQLEWEINLVPVVQEMDLVSAFDGGRLSIIDGELTTDQTLGYSGNYQVWEYGSPRLFYIGVNRTWGAQRRTLLSLCNEAVDRQKLVNLVLAGYGTPTFYPVYPESDTGKQLPDWEYRPMDIAEQLENLSKVSYGMTLLVNGDNEQKLALAQEIIRQWEGFGVRISLRALPYDDFIYALSRGDYELYIGEAYMTPDFDLSDLMVSGGAYQFGSSDTTLDRYWRDYRQRGLEVFVAYEENEEGEAVAVYNDDHVFSYMKEEVSLIPLFFKSGTMLSVWGHLDVATPVFGNMFYDLHRWTFR